MGILADILIILLLGILPNFVFLDDPIGFNYPKLAIIYLVTLVILVHGFITLKKDRQITCSDFLILMFTFIYFLSTIFSQSKYLAVFGDWLSPNKEGFLITICLLVIYKYFRKIADRKFLQKALFVTVLGVSFALLWGLIMQSGQAFYMGIPLRMSSLEYNTIYFSNLLIIGLPASLSLAIIQKTRKTKVIYTLVVLLISLGVILSLTRAVWISGTISIWLFFYLLLRLRTTFIKGWGMKLMKVYLIILVVLCFYLAPVITKRIKEPFNPPAVYSSINIRILEYGSALKIIKDYPLFGVGPDNVRIIFPKYRSLKLNDNLKEWNIGVGNIRSYYLNLMVNIGIFGGLIFLLLVVQIFKTILRGFLNMDSQIEQVAYLGLMISWLAVVINFLFYSSSLTAQIFFWVLSGILMGINKEKVFLKINLPPNFAPLVFWSILTGFFCILSVDVFSKLIFSQRVYQSEVPQRIELIARAISLNPFDIGYYYQQSQQYLPMIERSVVFHTTDSDQIKGWMEIVQSGLDFGEYLGPNDPQLWEDQAWLSLQKLRLGSSQEKEQLLEQELAIAQKALDLNPTSPRVADIITLGYLAMEGKKLKEAESSARYSIKLMPGYIIGHHHLGEALKQQGRFEEAILVYQQSLQYGSNQTFTKEEVEKIRKLQELNKN